MKVTLINTDDNTGGAAIACIRLQKALRLARGVESAVLVQEKRKTNPAVTALAQTPFEKRKAFFRFVHERLYFYFFERSREVRFAFSPAVAGTDITRHPLIEQAQLLHLHWINFGFLSLRSLQKLIGLQKPVVWTLHDMWAFTGGCHHSGDCDHYRRTCGDCKFLRNSGSNDLSHRINRQKQQVFRNANLTAVACSQWLAKRARESGLFQHIRVECIPNPIDTTVFAPGNQVAARRQLGIPEDKHLILFAAMKVGARGKGFSYFREALQILKDQYPQAASTVELLFIGQADPEIARELPFRSHVLGRIGEEARMVTVYQAASMFVTPSLEENLPNTIMEALSCGTPAVGFEIGGIPEMIDHRQNGYLAAYRSAEDLARGIAWILFEGDKTALARSAREKVLREYDEPVVAARYRQLYEQLLMTNH